ncbi:MAG: DUF1249 domain-containing protein [Gammaproteobacteria bacterium]|jgi:uncharacterized protein
MQITLNCRSCESPRPQSFAALMEMYEANYIRLRCLCGDIHALPDESVSAVPDALPLYLHVLERCKYTTTLNLTYYFQEAGELTPRPDLTLRVYHDARQVEVMSRYCNDKGGVVSTEDVLRHPEQSALLCKWRLNRFLYKWLSYCLRQNHGFALKPGNSDYYSQFLPQLA